MELASGMSVARSHILVVGDVNIELFVYPALGGIERRHARSKYVTDISFGGARRIGDMLSMSLDQKKFPVQKPSTSVRERESHRQTYDAICELEAVAADPHSPARLRIKRRQRLYKEPVWHSPQSRPPESEETGLLIFQDSESESRFRNVDEALDLLRVCCPRWLIYVAVHQPLGTGQIWDFIRRGPMTARGSQDPRKLIVILRAEDLRAEGIEISYGLSWEKTCESFVEKLGSNGKLDTIVTTANLIVLFGCDGVIYHRGQDMSEPLLIFDPLGQEGQFSNENIGNGSALVEAFVGGFAANLAQAPERFLDKAVRSGLSTARRLARTGLRLEISGPKYPIHTITSDFEPEILESLIIPSKTIVKGGSSEWSILHHNIGDPVQVAHQIVRNGIHSTVPLLPIAQFGSLTVIDRWEVEGFRTIYNATVEYLSRPQTRPLNIGVFGSPGSGKDFAAVQVATAAAEQNGRMIHHMRIDLSQLSGSKDLALSLVTARDCNLSGTLPIVYIKGFDTKLPDNHRSWLTHLIPLMHAGRIYDQGEMQHIGPAVLLHGSSTAVSLDDFTGEGATRAPDRRRSQVVFEEELGRRDDDDDEEHGKNTSSLWPKRQVDTLRQEFLSWLHAFVNVQGLNKLNPSDELYPVRRAVVLRKLLEEREPLLKDAESISVDESVLHGLLMVDQYRYGLRSLKTIIDMSKVTGKSHFEKSALPPKMQMSLHLRYDNFIKCCQYSILPDGMINIIAEQLHNTYLECRRKMSKNDYEWNEMLSQDSFKPWTKLSHEYKQSSRNHAADIPRKLGTISCFVAKQSEGRIPVKQFTDEELDNLSELEHERYNAERLQNQWHLGIRDEGQRSNPFLVPYADLAPEWENVDREMVKAYVSALPEEYKIYRLGKIAPAAKHRTPGRSASRYTL